MRPCLIALLGLLPLQAEAFSTDLPGLCDQAALRAAEVYDVPPQVMLAITRAETGTSRDGRLVPWPWTVNHAGDGRWFDNAAEAMAFAEAEIQNGTTNLDIGCFQLNLRWHAENFTSLEDMFDPAANADHAARFLAQNYRSKGNWVDAVAAYHSNTPEHARDYIEKVEAILTDLSPDATLPSPDQADIARVNRFPLLQPGSGAALASLVPVGDAGEPLFLSGPTP